jgi:hypothetical protein
MDRFSAYLLLRRFLRRPSSRELALAIEGIMEELADHCAPDQSTEWGILGLLSQLDLEYSARNARVRGATARAQAELEGLAPALARSLESFRGPASSSDARPVEDALVLAEVLGRAALGFEEDALEDPDEETPDEEAPAPRARRERSEGFEADLARALELRAGRGDPAGDRLEGALEGLGLDPARAARLALQGLRRAEGDPR